MPDVRTVRLVAGFAVALAVALASARSGAQAPANASPARQTAGGTLTRAEADEIVRAHNAWRKRAGVLPLRWARDLASQAQNRARQLASQGCIIEHGMLPDDVGENLFHAGPLRAQGRKDELFAVSPTQVVDAWGAESADYSPASDSCAPNRQCGHYTQLVWPSTDEVGCGMAVCPSLGQVWVCRYRPRGNVRVLR
jgi:pathogenesis-related protein 1